MPRVPALPSAWASDTGHIATHGVLAALLYWLLTPRVHSLRALFLAFVISSAIGLALEGLQKEFSDVREFQTRDIVADVFGAGLAVLALLTLKNVGVSRRFISAATVFVGTGIASGVIVSLAIWNPAFAYRGDHHHAYYGVIICGQLMPPMAAFHGGVHTHGTGFVHIHPQTPDEEGDKANLGLFFDLAGGELTAKSVTLQTGETYTNGDLCPDGRPGEFRVVEYDHRSGERSAPITSPEKYVFRDRTVLIEFVPTPVQQ